jgi:hypothetical protein
MIYSFIIKLKNSTKFIREYQIPSEYSLYDFKQFIVSELYFDDSQHSVFFLLDDNDRKIESYSLFDMGYGTMDTITLEDLSAKGMKKLLYTFDFFNDRSLSIEFIGEIEASPRIYYPFVAQSEGDAPEQFFEKIEDDLGKKVNITEEDEDEDEEDEDELYVDEYE